LSDKGRIENVALQGVRFRDGLRSPCGNAIREVRGPVCAGVEVSRSILAKDTMNT
jgi:hypothetical protein